MEFTYHLNSMKTTDSVLNFNQHSWFTKAKQLQRLQADVNAACIKLGFSQMNDCELYYDTGHLQIKTNAAFSTRLRQLEPDLKSQLNQNGWDISQISLVLTKNALIFSRHIKAAEWVNPNLLRFGARKRPTAEQRALLNLTSKSKKPSTR